MESSSRKPGFAYAAWVLLSIGAGLWLRWPTLDNGFASDDFVESAMLEGTYPAPRAPLDLFNFADGSSADNARLMRFGALPWWTVPGLRLAMMRPLSSALVVADRALFGRDARLYHVHSFVWWVVLMLVAAWLLRELFSAPVASLAIVLFALEEGHTLPLGWLANRGAMVAMVFGLLGVLVHVRARLRARPRLLLLSSLCFSIALLSGEWAFPLLGYVLAFELFGPPALRDSWRARFVSLLPSALPGLIFLATRAYFGYGALRSGVYIDPITEPVAFFIAACQRIPVFFADLFFSVPASWWGLGTPWRDRILALHVFSPEVWLRLPSWRFWHVAIGVLAMLATYFTLRAGLRDRDPGERRQIRWMLFGALISLVPMVASFPTSRLVLPAAVAVSVAAALVILRGLGHCRELWPLSPLRALLPLSVALTVCYFQVWQAGRTSYFESRVAEHGYDSVRYWLLHAEIDDAKIATQRVVLLNSIEHTSTIFGPFVRSFYGHPLPKSSWVLSGSPHAHDVYRPAANVLELSVLGGTMLTSDLETLYRDDRFPFRLGEVVQLDGLRVQVARMLWGKPQTVRFVFDKSVDDPSYLFLFSSPEGLVRARLPEVGERMRFRKATFPSRGLALAVRNERDPNVSCIGPRPYVEECRLGYFFADCGGNGESVFACHGLGDCRWFRGGCVAEDYMTSSCSARDACCEGGFPFPKSSWLFQLPVRQLVRAHLATWGREAWDGERAMRVSVEVDPKVVPTVPRVLCQGPGMEHGPCDASTLDLPMPLARSLRFAFVPAHGAPGWLLSTEVVDTRAGILEARVCKIALPEWHAQSGSTSLCPSAAPADCAVSGTLLLSRFPIEPSRGAELSARLRADFADGLHVEAEL